MTISLVSEWEFHKATGTSTQDLTGITADVGDWLVAVHHQRTSAAFAVTLTDSAGNTWVERAANVSGSGNSRIVVLTCQVTSALTAGTVTLTHGGTHATTISISRWTGVADTLGASSANAISAAAAAPALSVLGRAGVIVAGATYNSDTAPSALADGYTALTGFSPGSSCYGANAYLIAPDGVVGSSPSWTLPASVAWGAAAVALVEAGFDAGPADEPFVANPRPMQPPTHIDQARVVNFVDVLVDPAAAEATITAQLPAALASLTAAAGPNESAGAVDADLPAVTAALTGTVPAYATLDADLPAAVALVRGWADAAGRITVVLPAATGALPADADARARITGDLRAVTAVWRASAPAAGVLEVVLPAVTGTLTARAPAAAVVAAVLPSVAGALAAIVATRRNVTLTLGPPRARSFTVTGPTGRDLALGAPHGRVLSVSAPHD